MSIDQSGLESLVPSIKDLGKVTQRETSGRIRHLEGKIVRGQANPHQIREWFLSKDPLEESERLKVLRGTDGGVVGMADRAIREAYLYEQAAVSMLTQIGVMPHDGYSGAGAVDHIQQRIEKEPIEAEDVISIIFGVEMLGEASFTLNNTKLLAKKVGLVERNSKLPEYQNVDQRIKDLRMLGIGLLLFLRNRFINDKEITDPQLRLLGAEAVFRYSTSLNPRPEDNPSNIEVVNDFRGENLIEMISSLENIFLGDKGLLNDRSVPKSTVKGKLFEFDWILDAYMFNILRGDYDTEIIMSSPKNDSPRVGHPQLNRGSDICIRNPQNGMEYFVQLKSSGQQKNKRYHPLIEVAHEQNFQDANPGRLSNKLRAYRAFIESSFDPSRADEVRRYILPTVVEILEKEREPSDSYDKLASFYGIPARQRPVVDRKTPRITLKLGGNK